MKPILEIKREQCQGLTLLYVRYASKKPFGAQQDLNESGNLMVDWAEDGSIVGIELIAPDADDIKVVEQFAREQKLSLDGLFSHAA